MCKGLEIEDLETQTRPNPGDGGGKRVLVGAIRGEREGLMEEIGAGWLRLRLRLREEIIVARNSRKGGSFDGI